MTLQDARHIAKHHSQDGIVRHVVFDARMSHAKSPFDDDDFSHAYIIATPEDMASDYAQLEQDDILFVYRDGKEY